MPIGETKTSCSNRLGVGIAHVDKFHISIYILKDDGLNQIYISFTEKNLCVPSVARPQFHSYVGTISRLKVTKRHFELLWWLMHMIMIRE